MSRRAIEACQLSENRKSWSRAPAPTGPASATSDGQPRCRESRRRLGSASSHRPSGAPRGPAGHARSSCDGSALLPSNAGSALRPLRPRLAPRTLPNQPSARLRERRVVSPHTRTFFRSPRSSLLRVGDARSPIRYQRLGMRGVTIRRRTYPPKPFRHALQAHQLPRPPCRHASAVLPTTPPPCRHAIFMVPTTPPPCRQPISMVPTTPPPCRQASVMLPTTPPPCRHTLLTTYPSPPLWKIHK